MSEPVQPEFDGLVPPVLVEKPTEYVDDGLVLYEVVQRAERWVRVRDACWPHWSRTLPADRLREVIPEPDFESLGQ